MAVPKRFKFKTVKLKYNIIYNNSLYSKSWKNVRYMSSLKKKFL